MSDPIDVIREICHDAPDDALSQIAAVLGFDDSAKPADLTDDQIRIIANAGRYPISEYVGMEKLIEFARGIETQLAERAAVPDEMTKNADRYRWVISQAKITDFIFSFLNSRERHVNNAIDAAMLKAAPQSEAK